MKIDLDSGLFGKHAEKFKEYGVSKMHPFLSVIFLH